MHDVRYDRPKIPPHESIERPDNRLVVPTAVVTSRNRRGKEASLPQVKAYFSWSGLQDLNLRPLDPQEVAVAHFPSSLKVLTPAARCATFMDAQVVQHRA